MVSFKVPKPTELTKFYINGEYVEPSTKEVFAVRNPKDDTIVSDSVPVGGVEDVDAAVRHAEAAFKGEWSEFTSAERARCLYRLSEVLDEHLEELLRLDTLTGGHPVSLIPTRERDYIVNGLRYMCEYNNPVHVPRRVPNSLLAGWCDKFKGDYLPDDDGFVKIVKNEPLG